MAVVPAASTSLKMSTDLATSDIKNTPEKVQTKGRERTPSGSSQSRSTSAGSSTPPQSSHGEGSPVIALAKLRESSPLVVRNTFLDAPVGRPISLEGFFNERVVHSCPASRPTSFDEIGCPPGLEDLAPPGLSFGAPYVSTSKVSGAVDPSDAESPPFTIKNTFIDAPVLRPMSLDGFFKEREIKSCPQSRFASFDDCGLPPGMESILESLSQQKLCPQSRFASFDDCGLPPGMESILEYALSEAHHPVCLETMPPVGTPTPPPVVELCPVLMATNPAPPVPAPPVAPRPADSFVLRLSDALAEPNVGSLAMPTKGSAGHGVGTCKPCAFFFTKGCESGVNCEFCHLCGPEEKKKRKLDKKQLRRMGVAPDAIQSLASSGAAQPFAGASPQLPPGSFLLAR